MDRYILIRSAEPCPPNKLIEKLPPGTEVVKASDQEAQLAQVTAQLRRLEDEYAEKFAANQKYTDSLIAIKNKVTQERDALEMSLNKWRAISRDQETELAQAQQAIVKVTNEFNWANKHLHEAQQREVQAHRIFAWLLGEEGDFPDEPEPLAGKYRQRFWWRKELREKMNTLTPSPMSTHPTRSDIGDSVCQMEEGKP